MGEPMGRNWGMRAIWLRGLLAALVLGWAMAAAAEEKYVGIEGHWEIYVRSGSYGTCSVVAWPVSRRVIVEDIDPRVGELDEVNLYVTYRGTTPRDRTDAEYYVGFLIDDYLDPGAKVEVEIGGGSGSGKFSLFLAEPYAKAAFRSFPDAQGLVDALRTGSRAVVTSRLRGGMVASYMFELDGFAAAEKIARSHCR